MGAAADEYVLDTPVVRGFVEDVRRAIADAADPADACDRIRPRFAELLADDGWLPAGYLVGLYRGTQDEEIYGPGDGALELRERRALATGDFYALIPPRDDIHRVRTTSDVTSVSIHLLTNDTGCVWRHAYDPDSGAAEPFRSGYVNVACDDDETA